MGDQIARYLQALLHAARVGVGQVVYAACVQLHALHPLLGLAAQVTVVARAQRHKALAHVGATRHIHAQAVARMLLHKAPVGACQPAQAHLRHGGQVLQPFGYAVRLSTHVVVHRAFVARMARCQQAQQRALARARLAHHRQDLAGVQIKTHPPASPARLALVDKGLARIAH